MCVLPVSCAPASESTASVENNPRKVRMKRSPGTLATVESNVPSVSLRVRRRRFQSHFKLQNMRATKNISSAHDPAEEEAYAGKPASR